MEHCRKRKFRTFLHMTLISIVPMVDLVVVHDETYAIRPIFLHIMIKVNSDMTLTFDL